MKFGVISSRSRNGAVFTDEHYVYSCLGKAIRGFNPDGDPVEFISGGGRGPEQFAIDYAEKTGIPCSKIAPRIKALKERAFVERNRSIADACDVLVVFWAGEELHVPNTLHDAALLNKTSLIFPI